METAVLAADTIPLFLRRSAVSLGLFMSLMTAALPAKLLEFQPSLLFLLVLRRNVVPALALRALQSDVVSRHNSLYWKTSSIATEGSVPKRLSLKT